MTIKDGDCKSCEHFVKDAYGQFVCEFDGECENMVREMTNEEWFCGLPTEEKAKFIFWQHFDVYGKTLYELMVNASRGVSRDKQAEVMIGAVVEWLKEKHE